MDKLIIRYIHPLKTNYDMKRYIVLLFLIFIFSAGHSQGTPTDTIQNSAEELKRELREVRKKVAEGEAEAKKARKEAAAKKKKEKLKKEFNSKAKAIGKQEKKVEKLQKQLEKGQLKGTLAPVDIQKIETRIAKIQLDILKDQERLQKLKRKM